MQANRLSFLIVFRIRCVSKYSVWWALGNRVQCVKYLRLPRLCWWMSQSLRERDNSACMKMDDFKSYTAELVKVRVRTSMCFCVCVACPCFPWIFSVCAGCALFILPVTKYCCLQHWFITVPVLTHLLTVACKLTVPLPLQWQNTEKLSRQHEATYAKKKWNSVCVYTYILIQGMHISLRNHTHEG